MPRPLTTTGAAIAIAFLWAGTALAADLPVSSQNTLHLSASKKGVKKRRFFLDQDAFYDVNLLQEVMKTADLSKVTPGSYKFLLSGLKGQSSYKEAYAIVYDKDLTPESGMEDYKGSGKSKFARPPSGAMFLLRDGDTRMWFVDYHAIFGKSVSVRRAEVGLMANVYNYFADLDVGGETTDQVMIGGDWNLGADDTGFSNIKKLGNIAIKPNVETSLTRAGKPSEKYDHFVSKTTEVDADDYALTGLQGESSSWFRSNVSDHRGIDCMIEYDTLAERAKKRKK